MVSTAVPVVLFVQPMLVKLAQVPLNTSKTASESVVGVTVTTCFVVVAVNWYHTSSSAVPAHPTCD
mgnify:CR=1 FL=1